MIGKEIVRFHCVYWPAFLLAADLPLPKSIVAHGWLLFEESKMSKSRGNIVRSETILDTLGGDALRYFLLREIVFGSDGSFSFDALVQRFNADLANGLGQSIQPHAEHDHALLRGRNTLSLAPGARRAADDAVAELAQQTIADFHAQFEQFQFSRALETAWGLVAAVNKYIVENEPWAVAERDDKDSVAGIAFMGNRPRAGKWPGTWSNGVVNVRQVACGWVRLGASFTSAGAVPEESSKCSVFT